MADPVSKKRKTSPTSTTTPAASSSSSSSSSGRTYTLSIAVPSTLLSTAPNPVLKTHLAGHLARISALHNVDEIVLYTPTPTPTPSPSSSDTKEDDQLPHILTYLATPPYLRKHLFPKHRHLRHVGLLPPLDLPTHPRPGAPAPFRRAVALEARPGGKVAFDAGLEQPVVIASEVEVGTTALLRMGGGGGAVEAPPRRGRGTYVGYEVRGAEGLAAVFTECGWEGGYDLTVGVACGGGGVPLDEAVRDGGAVPAFRHLLVAVGDLEGAARGDAGLVGVGVGGARELFDLWVDPLPGCGSAGVRVEEALFAALVGLRRVVVEKGVR
ncbi:uncharacterized protein H6S33_002479 [Morchella sextelata]|uniref:uncharacterized protein n=1 Tax=Morchella sextelata TaxID=1174677 RepID=UPI001D048343|nr:uncharacterized protein H6S33_002479 [Morchella sextelata]KAH0607445.1 hypothetical protein H6S33_002479 [Morchella sextelata]